MAKASGQNGSDCEERKLGEQNGLDTPFFKSCTKKCNVGISLREIPRNDCFCQEKITTIDCKFGALWKKRC
jgi:hypothetical protein